MQQLLVPTTSAVTRCEGSCTNGQMCVRLRGGEEFVRISVQSEDPKSPARIVLWRGARDEIYQGGTIYSVCMRCPLNADYDLVDVTRWRPRSPFLPFWFPNLAAEMIQCVSRLPVPSLTRLRPDRQIHSGLNAVHIFTQPASASATRWWHFARRHIPTSQACNFCRDRC